WMGAICVVLAGSAVGRRLPFPEAVVWCVLGYAVGFLPGVAGLRLDPHTALFLILPPLVYASSVRLPWPEFRANLRPIALLAAGLSCFAAIVVGGPLYGCLLGIAVVAIRKRITDPRLEITVSLLTPFAAYLLPEFLGGSGILATVATGMYVGEQRSAVVPAGA